MKTTSTAALVLAATAILSGPSAAENRDGYVTEVVLSRDGEVVASSKGVTGADGSFRAAVEKSRTYRKEVSIGAGQRPTERTDGILRTGFDFDVGLRDTKEDLIVAAKANYTELVSLDAFSVSGETIDLPNVNGWSLSDSGAAKRVGDGWRYEARNASNRLTLTVTLTPGS